MARSTRTALPLVLVTAAYACAGPSEPCADPAFSLLQDEAKAGDWRTEIDSMIAVAPPDSLLDIGIFVTPSWTQVVHDSVVAAGGQITYEFRGFSALRASITVGGLERLRGIDGITGIDWGVGFIYPHCGGPTQRRVAG